MDPETIGRNARNRRDRPVRARGRPPRRRSAALLALPLFAAGVARAQTVNLAGYAEALVVHTPSERSSSDGGLGKLRWGGAGNSERTRPELGALLLQPSVGLPYNVRLSAEFRYDTQQKTAVDILDAALSWTPPPFGAWSAALKLGAFFPPFGLENTDIGWTSPYTITSSALGSWVGEELRTIGGQATIGWRNDSNVFKLTGALYALNDPAGVILADRGWILTNRPLGLFDHLRIPDATARLFGRTGPSYTPEFREIDDRPGFYAGASWERPGLGRVQVFRYDNLADPAARRDTVYGWRTSFWEAGLTSTVGPFTVIAEGMTGQTTISPGGRPSRTDFHAAYVLGAWTRNDWRAALRLEAFGTDGALSERGRAVTAAVSWVPPGPVQVVGEVLAVQSTRSQRVLAGKPARTTAVEPQLAVRVSF